MTAFTLDCRRALTFEGKKGRYWQKALNLAVGSITVIATIPKPWHPSIHPKVDGTKCRMLELDGYGGTFAKVKDAHGCATPPHGLLVMRERANKQRDARHTSTCNTNHGGAPLCGHVHRTSYVR